MNTEQTYHTPNVVQQRREEAAAINAAMNPAPALPAGVGINPAPYAGKLSDEQLGEIGATAAAHWFNENGQEDQRLMYVSETGPYAHSDTPARTAFAAAVREAVEKEQAEEIEKLKNAHAMEFVCLNKVLPINRDGSVKIVDHAIATVRYLTTASAQQAEEIARLTAEVQSLNESYRVAGRVVREVQAELAKANAELERLRWRSVEVKPTREDADPEGFIEVMGKTDKRFLIPWYEVGLGKESLWRPFCPPPTPSAEEKSRTEFEAWIKQMFPGYALSKTDTGSYKDLNTRIAFAGWQAHAPKEVK